MHRFVTNEDRVRHRDELIPLLGRVFRDQDRDRVDRCARSGIGSLCPDPSDGRGLRLTRGSRADRVGGRPRTWDDPPSRSQSPSASTAASWIRDVRLRSSANTPTRSCAKRDRDRSMAGATRAVGDPGGDHRRGSRVPVRFPRRALPDEGRGARARRRWRIPRRPPCARSNGSPRVDACWTSGAEEVPRRSPSPAARASWSASIRRRTCSRASWRTPARPASRPERSRDDGPTSQNRSGGRTWRSPVTCSTTWRNSSRSHDVSPEIAGGHVVFELTERHPLHWMNDLWLRFHGLERPDGPTSEDALEALTELGLDPLIERWTASPRGGGFDRRTDAVALDPSATLPSPRPRR